MICGHGAEFEISSLTWFQLASTLRIPVCFFFLLTLPILQAKKAKSKHIFDHVDVAILASQTQC